MRPARTRGVLGCAALFTFVSVWECTRVAAQFVWDAPQGCPDWADVESRIPEPLPGRAPKNARLKANAHVTTDAAGYRLDFHTAQGERSLHAATCDELASAAALLLGLLRDSMADSAPPVSSQRDVAALLGVSVALDWGSLPELAWGPSLRAGIRLYATSITAAGQYLPPQQVGSPASFSGAAVRGTVTLATAGVSVCQALTPVIELSPCALFEYGQIWVGRGQSSDTRSDWALLLVGARVSTAIDRRWHILLDLSVGVPWTRVDYSTLRLGRVYSPPAVLARLHLGFEFRL